MIDLLKKLFGGGPKVDYAQLLKEGAVVLDVRSPGEFASGHVKGAINIPLDRLAKDAKKIKAKGAILTCCASGMRSASAASQLRSMGFQQVYNAGPWTRLRNLN
ncbi:MAG: rhodanese-like domain-containing protein [Flavobacteriales bacterium]|mgnify:FL=1|nr:rhodanese-like domain-containing protein [Flavobacteriales bacterium]